MKRQSKVFLLIFSFLMIAAFYVLFTRPDKEKIAERLKEKYSETVTPGSGNYDSLVKIDLQGKQAILFREVIRAQMYSNPFSVFTHKFNLDETRRILKIVTDSTNFRWGEIGTPFFDNTIVLLDKNENRIGYIDVSFDGQINMFPNLAVTKWGLLADKGFKELVTATRTR